MAKSGKKNQKEQEYEKFALRKPGLTVLTDHALRPDEAYRDSFNLRYKLGPVYDIVRYPDTRTPMAIAVYGDWGTGKTTAMKWLHGLIDQWNQSGTANRKVRVRPVWFYPWKYHSQEDVWRGLIGEVILNAIDVKTATVKTVTEALKMLGMFVGKSAIDIISAAKIGVPGFELSGESVEKIAEDFKEAAHPEKLYLNPFENALRIWVQKSLGKNQRMVIFIDDLDRCMPDVALQVLEALKLYLNIENLIFVVGVDRNVVDRLVKEHYKRLGLDEDKSKNYLAKMFQVEVQIEPTEQQISNFLDEQLKEIPYWNAPHLSDEEQGLFRDLIFKLAERNPREIKRLINSALMTGAGAVMIKGPAATEGRIKFNQGLQLFFVRKILDQRYTMGSEVGRKRGIEFFSQWSRIVCKGTEKDKDFPCRIEVPEDFTKQFAEAQHITEGSLEDVSEQMQRREQLTHPSFAPEAYHDLLQNPRFSGLLHLLADEDLGRLMQIPYPVEVTEITAVIGTSKDADVIREAIARQVKKKTDDLTDSDYRTITQLNLSDSEISDLESIRGLTSLERLDLTNTRVKDLKPISELTSLQSLYLSSTQVSDLEPIRGLTSLQSLYVSSTQVRDPEPIRGLTSLQELDLSSPQVADLEPIRGLTTLRLLYLSRTQVSELEPIRALTSLQRLSLRNTRVSDLEPISSLTSLQLLYLENTQVTDLGPIRGFANLQMLFLRGTQVSDLGPIRGLTRLQALDLRGTPVSDDDVGTLQKALPELKVFR